MTTAARTFPGTHHPRLSLRRRLTLGLVALVVLVLVGAGVVMTLSVRSFVMRQLDRELVTTVRELAASENFDPSGLREGTVVVARTASGQLVQAPVLIAPPGDGDNDRDDPGSGQLKLSTDDLASMSAAAYEPTTIELNSLGDYRALTVTAPQDRVLTVGLPLSQVNDTLGRLLLIEAITLAVAGLIVAVGGAWLIRRELLPLDRVARTARDIAALPLSSGAPKLDQRVPEAHQGTEIGDVTGALNEMLDHLDLSLAERAETEQQLRQFVADASHELRTPLSSIRGYAELYRRPGVTEPDRELALSRIESETQRMGSIVDDLLLLARLDQGRALLSDPVDVSLLAVEASNDSQVAAPDHPISVEVPSDSVFVTGDEFRLRQVLANLITNAVQHTPIGTPIRVSVTAAADRVNLTVADNGPGMPVEFQPHAFERFARADVSRFRGSGGSGLGLSIVAAIVHALHGEVRLASSSSGTTVDITLLQSDPPPV